MIIPFHFYSERVPSQNDPLWIDMWDYLVGGATLMMVGVTLYHQRYQVAYQYIRHKVALTNWGHRIYQKYLLHPAPLKQPELHRLIGLFDDGSTMELEITDRMSFRWDDLPHLNRVEMHYRDIDDGDYIRIIPRGEPLVFPIYDLQYQQHAFITDLEYVTSTAQRFDEQQWLRHSGPLGTFYRDTATPVKLGWIRTVEGQPMFQEGDTITYKTLTDIPRTITPDDLI